MAMNSGLSMIFPLKMVIFNSYVKLPEGNANERVAQFSDDEFEVDIAT